MLVPAGLTLGIEEACSEGVCWSAVGSGSPPAAASLRCCRRYAAGCVVVVRHGILVESVSPWTVAGGASSGGAGTGEGGEGGGLPTEEWGSHSGAVGSPGSGLGGRWAGGVVIVWVWSFVGRQPDFVVIVWCCGVAVVMVWVRGPVCRQLECVCGRHTAWGCRCSYGVGAGSCLPPTAVCG